MHSRRLARRATIKIADLAAGFVAYSTSLPFIGDLPSEFSDPSADLCSPLHGTRRKLMMAVQVQHDSRKRGCRQVRTIAIHLENFQKITFVLSCSERFHSIALINLLKFVKREVILQLEILNIDSYKLNHNEGVLK